VTREPSDDFESKLRATMKKELRRSMVATRSILTDEARAVRNAALATRLAACSEIGAARVVAGYVAARKECDPEATLAAALARGATVALPRVDLGNDRIEWRRHTRDRELVRGAFGILEPGPDSDSIDPATIAVVLVPGVAFDVRGHRLGLGKGFYDRALPELTSALRIGLAYDFQLVDELPVEAHDVAMHLVVTDARLVDAR